MGIEPTYLAWKASVLPLNYTRTTMKFLVQKLLICYQNIFKTFCSSGWQDSNLRPLDPKSSALAKLSHTPFRCSFRFVFVFLAQRKIYYITRSTKCQHFFLFFLHFFILQFTRVPVHAAKSDKTWVCRHPETAKIYSFWRIYFASQVILSKIFLWHCTFNPSDIPTKIQFFHFQKHS